MSKTGMIPLASDLDRALAQDVASPRIEPIFLDGLVNTLAEHIDGRLSRDGAREFARLLTDCESLREEEAACRAILRLDEEVVPHVKFSSLDRIRRLAAISDPRNLDSSFAAAAPKVNEAGTPSAVATEMADFPRLRSQGDTLYSGHASEITIYTNRSATDPAKDRAPTAAPAPRNTTLDRGLGLAQQGNYVGAIAEFNVALRSDPGNVAALQARGDAYRDMGDCQRAANDYTAALAVEPENAGLLVRRGQARQLLGQHAEAIVDFSLALEIAPHDLLSFNHRGQSREALGETQRAIGDYTAALSIDPRNAWALQARGQALLAARRPVEALSDFEELVRQRPRFAVAYGLRGDARRAKGELDRAIDDYTEALALDPRHVPSLVERGLAWRQKGRFERAIGDLGSALSLEPNNAALFDHRGMAYRQQGELAKALADFDAAIRLDPAQAHFYNHRGNIQFTSGALDAAVADYSQALKLKPLFANCLINRGNAYFQRGEYEPAVADYAAAIEQDPKLPRAWLNRGMALLRIGRSEAAIADCSEAIARDPKMAQAWCYRGAAHVAAGSLDRAIEDLTEAIKLDPKMALAYNERGMARAKSGLFHDAVADHSAAVRLEPENALWHANRAQAWQSLNELDRVLADYAAAVTLDSKYLSAYAGARARWHEAQGQHRFAAADAILALRVDPDNLMLARLRDASTHAARPTFDQDLPAGIAPARGTPQAPMTVASLEPIEDGDSESVLADDVSRRRQSRKELGSQIWSSADSTAAAASALNGMINRRKPIGGEETLIPLAADEKPAPAPRPAPVERKPRPASRDSSSSLPRISLPSLAPSVSSRGKAGIAGGLLAASVLLAAFMFWPKSTEEAQAVVVAQVPAPELVTEFAKDMASANGKYAGQLLTVKGKVREVVTGKGRPKVLLVGANQVPWSVECSFAQNEIMGSVGQGQEVTLTGTVELRTSFKAHVQLYSCQWGVMEPARVALAVER